jgi:hypothetical protein
LIAHARGGARRRPPAMVAHLAVPFFLEFGAVELGLAKLGFAEVRALELRSFELLHIGFELEFAA